MQDCVGAIKWCGNLREVRQCQLLSFDAENNTLRAAVFRDCRWNFEWRRKQLPQDCARVKCIVVWRWRPFSQTHNTLLTL